MRNALRDITSDIESLVSLKPGDVVLDIGSNDGTLLRSYTAQGIERIGVEPATNLAQAGSVGVSLINDFWSKEVYQNYTPKLAKAITAIGMFYDLDDPLTFVKDIAACLAPDGLFIAQLMCLKNMLNLNDIGNLAHEHLEFYSMDSLYYMLSQCGLELIDIETNKVNGESYRLYIQHRKGPIKPHPGNSTRLYRAWKSEKELDDPEYYKDLFTKIENNKFKVHKFIKQEVKAGKKVWILGASTKGNVILQYYGLDHKLIQGASERSPEKWGRFTIGTGIPIVSEEEARAAKPDYFLVLPYAFIDEFVEREKEWIEGGGRFIVPLPEMRIVPGDIK